MVSFSGVPREEFRSLCGYGGHAFLSWLLPFLSSFLFFDANGTMMVEFRTFKTAMTISGQFLGAACLRWATRTEFAQKRLVRAEQGARQRFLLVTAILFLVTDWVLDILVLIPLQQSTGRVDFDVLTYFKEIGLRYLGYIPMAWLLSEDVVITSRSHKAGTVFSEKSSVNSGMKNKSRGRSPSTGNKKKS